MSSFKKLIQVVDNPSEENIKSFIDKTEKLCQKYDLLKSKAWINSNEEACSNKNLPSLRLELKWRDKLLKEICPITGIKRKNSIKDLGIVFQFGSMSFFRILESAKSSDIEEHKKLRTHSNLYLTGLALMYQLKIPFFLTYKDNYRKIELPKSKKDIPFGLLDIMTKEDKDKLIE